MDEAKRLRDALHAFEAACQAVIDAGGDADEIARLLDDAEARLAEARLLLDGIRKRQAHP